MRVARLLKITGVVVGLLVIAAAGIGIYVYHSMHSDPFMPLYAENCAVCHGAAFEGAAQGPPLVGRALSHGESVADISRSIAAGIPERGMPGWSGLLGEGRFKASPY